MPRLPRPARAALSLLALMAAAPALAQTAPVREVTLFEAGLAELTRATGPASEVTLQVPLRDVNDLLKSLLLRGTGITGASLRLDSQTPVEDAFANLPFPPEAATDLATLLASVPGLQLRLSDRAYPEGQEGTLIGTREECDADGGCRTILSLLGGDGAVSFHALTPDLRIAILDPQLVADLGRGLAALRQAASGTVREIAIRIEGADVVDGALSYVVAAPAWKTSYRALTGPAGAVSLQAWAVVENATGEDWEDVALTLSSGSPNTLSADLMRRDWRHRPDVTLDDALAGAPMPVVVAEPMARAAGAFDEAEAAPSFAAPPPAPVGSAAQAAEGVLDSRFTFPAPIDLAAGELLSLPFLSGAIEATNLSLWQGSFSQRTGNPDMMLEVTNDRDVRLPAGIMTVSDEAGGYLGDADFPLVGPGESKAMPYGLDRRLRVEETPAWTERQVSVRAAEGVVRIATEQVRETTYLATSPSGEARALVIDHPLDAGWTTRAVAGPQGTARQDDDGRRWMRFALEVPGGADGAKLVVRDTQPLEQVVALGDLPADAILAYVGQATDPADKAYLEAAARLARSLSQAEAALGRADEAHRNLLSEQNRVRALLTSVQNPSQAYDRFLSQLLALEDRIADAVSARDAALAARDEARAALTAHLAG